MEKHTRRGSLILNFDPFAEFHAVSTHERDKVSKRDHGDSAEQVQPERRFQYGKQHQGIVGGVSLDREKSENESQYRVEPERPEGKELSFAAGTSRSSF